VSVMNVSVMNVSVMNVSVMNVSVMNVSVMNVSVTNGSVMNVSVMNVSVVKDLGHFVDGTFRRWWSQMFYWRKKCVFEILQWLDCKGCMLHKCFCCHPEGRCGFSSSGRLEELSAMVLKPWPARPSGVAREAIFIGKKT